MESSAANCSRPGAGLASPVFSDRSSNIREASSRIESDEGEEAGGGSTGGTPSGAIASVAADRADDSSVERSGMETSETDWRPEIPSRRLWKSAMEAWDESWLRSFSIDSFA